MVLLITKAAHQTAAMKLVESPADRAHGHAE